MVITFILRFIASPWFWCWMLSFVLWGGLLWLHRRKNEQEGHVGFVPIGSPRHNRRFLLVLSFICLFLGGLVGSVVKIVCSTVMLAVLLN